MKIGIIIVNFNRERYTRNCLISLSNIEKDNFDITTILVDNNSSAPLSITEKDFKEIGLKIIKNDENLGFSGGNNVGIKKALENNCDLILLINNDTTQKPDFLIKLIKGLEKEDGEVASPKIYFSKGREFHKDRYSKDQLGKVIWYAGGIFDQNNVLASHRGVDQADEGQFEKNSETDFATGCCMIIKRKVFEKIGIFDDRYFLYLEDLDLSVRAKKAGFKIVFIPGSVIWHENAGSTGGSGSSLQDYFITRNRLLFGSTYMPLRNKFALFKESLKLMINGRKWQRIGVKDFYLGRFGKGSMV